MANKYFTSNNEALTQRQIDLKRSWAYRNKHNDNPEYWCHGCGQRAQGNAHIIPQARCKQLHKTELIWDWNNFFPACHGCNSIAENVSSIEITKLKNFNHIKEFMEIHDPERASKIPESRLAKDEPHKI